MNLGLKNIKPGRGRNKKRLEKSKKDIKIRAAIKFILSPGKDITTGKFEFVDSLRRQFNRIGSLSEKQQEILFSIYNEIKTQDELKKQESEKS